MTCIGRAFNHSSFSHSLPCHLCAAPMWVELRRNDTVTVQIVTYNVYPTYKMVDRRKVNSADEVPKESDRQFLGILFVAILLSDLFL